MIELLRLDEVKSDYGNGHVHIVFTVIRHGKKRSDMYGRIRVKLDDNVVYSQINEFAIYPEKIFTTSYDFVAEGGKYKLAFDINGKTIEKDIHIKNDVILRLDSPSGRTSLFVNGEYIKTVKGEREEFAVNQNDEIKIVAVNKDRFVSFYDYPEKSGITSKEFSFKAVKKSYTIYAYYYHKDGLNVGDCLKVVVDSPYYKVGQRFRVKDVWGGMYDRNIIEGNGIILDMKFAQLQKDFVYCEGDNIE